MNPPSHPPPVEPSRCQRILFCADFSESAEFAFDFAIDATLRHPGASLYLLHVVPEAEAQFWNSYLYEVEHVDDQARHDIDAKIADTYLSRLPPGLPVRVEIRPGSDAPKILEFAEEARIDLIIMGRQGTGVERALFGRVTDKVARKARCPVMIVPLSYRR